MENDRDFFEEEYSPTGGKKPKAGKWIMLAACFIVACAIAAAYFKFRPDVLKAAPKDIVTAAEPDTMPDGAAAAPEATKAPQEDMEPEPTMDVNTEPGEGEYVATAIMLDGKCVGVLASREAAEEVLDEAVRFFELKIQLPGALDSTIKNELELAEAGADKLKDADAPTQLTYEEMLALLTGEKTPLKVESVLKEKQTSIVKREVKTEKDDTLIKGTRLVASYGSDGESRTVTTTRFINGEQKGKSESETFEISQKADTIIREGTKKLDAYAEPGKREGEKGPDAGELKFIRPTKSGEISENFGQLKGVMHLGLDFSAKEGDEVYAAEAGTVTTVMERGGYGLVIEIDHGSGFLTRYAHLSQAMVSIGDTVAKGDTIALAGSSGNCKKPALHFELRQAGFAYNPRYYLK